jgi:outer membrane protein assembly factor BamA
MLLVRFERDPVRPYYGIGNQTLIDGTLRGAERRARYLHTLMQPQATLTVERPIGGGFEIAAAVLGAYQQIETSPQSLLALEAPVGVDGGVLAEVTAEVALDTRDNEASPISGAYVELIGRAGQLAGKHLYGGGALVARGYISPFGSAALTVATRFDVDLLLGEVPFTRLGTFAGRPPVAGLGGATSMRGLPRFLLIGNLKALGNLELRSRLRRFRPGEHTLDVAVAGFVDAGRVWAGSDRGLPFTNLHATVGGGVRLAWEEDYVVRLDVGRSFEGFTGVYLDFAQAF